MSLGYYEDWSKTVLGKRRRVRARDWKAPRRLMDRTDKELGACKAWILGGSAGDSTDQPCIVFLTNRALYVDVWPYRSIAVDLPRGRRGAAFGQLVVNTVGTRAGRRRSLA